MTTYTVSIKNNSEDQQYPRRYYVYAEPPKVESQAYQSSWPVICWSSPALSAGSEAEFEFTSDYYGFVGTSFEIDSKNLKVGNKVKATSSKLVALVDPAPELLVDKENDSIKINEADTPEASPVGTFRVTMRSSLAPTNKTVTGLARKFGSSTVAVAAIAVKPTAKAVFTPKPEIYIVRGEQGVDYKSGTLLKLETIKDKAHKIDFSGGDSNAVDIMEDDNGAITSTYKSQ